MRKWAVVAMVAAVLGTGFLDEYYGGWWWLIRWPLFIAFLYLWATRLNTWRDKRRAARNPSTGTEPA